MIHDMVKGNLKVRFENLILSSVSPIVKQCLSGPIAE